MPSRFPGVDPYIEWENFWQDFHSSFVTYWRDAIIDALPDHYSARMNERVNLIEYKPGYGKLIGPDVAIAYRETAWQTWSGPSDLSSDSAVATLEPVTLPITIESEESRETFIEIYHRPDEQLVAVLELLSPTNKSGTDRVRYLDKRLAILHQDVHLVELDFLLSGQRLPVDGTLPPGDFYATVSRFTNRPYCDIYAWTLRDHLPAIPIPLLPPDGDLRCDLAAVFAQTFARGRYDRTLRYGPPPEARFTEIVRPWMASQ